MIIRKFVIRIMIVLMVILLCTLVHRQIHQQIFSVANIKFADNIETIICGNSRLKLIDPSTIPNTVNITNGGELYYFTYFVLKKALKTNKNIKNVILSSSFDNFVDDIAIKNRKEFIYEKEILKPYIDIIDKDELLKKAYFHPEYWELWLMRLGVPLHFENTLKLLLKYKFTPLEHDNIPYFGTFYTSYQSNLSEESLNFWKSFFTEEKISPWPEKWFIKIIEMCQEKNINVTVIAPPLHPSYYNLVPENFKENYHRIIDVSKKKYVGVNFLNCTQVTFPDTCFGDSNHLNSYGIPFLVNKINTELQNKSTIENAL